MSKPSLSVPSQFSPDGGSGWSAHVVRVAVLGRVRRQRGADGHAAHEEHEHQPDDRAAIAPQGLPDVGQLLAHQSVAVRMRGSIQR